MSIAKPEVIKDIECAHESNSCMTFQPSQTTIVRGTVAELVVGEERSLNKAV